MLNAHPSSVFAEILASAAAANIAAANAIAAAANQYTPLTDTQLLAEADRLARRVSFYNAAEGEWSRETIARNAANACFRACEAEVMRRGLVLDRKGYLV